MRNLLALSLLLFGTSCGSASTTTYVGTVDGTDVAVGLVTDGTNIALFFCGGATSFDTSTKWMRFSSTTSAFTTMKDTWTASGMTTTTAANGTVDRGDGMMLTWTASRAPDDSIIGLYESETSTGTSGVIVQSATDATATQGAFIDPQLKIEQIIPIFPLDLESQGLHVQIDGADAFVPRATTQ